MSARAFAGLVADATHAAATDLNPEVDAVLLLAMLALAFNSSEPMTRALDMSVGDT